MRTPMSEIAVEPERGQIFCGSPHALNWARETAELAQRCFPVDCEVSFTLEQDPESEVQWLLVDVAVKQNATDVLGCYRRFTAQWIEQMPSEVRSLIRVTFHVV